MNEMKEKDCIYMKADQMEEGINDLEDRNKENSVKRRLGTKIF